MPEFLEVTPVDERTIAAAEVEIALRTHPCVVDAHVADLPGIDGRPRRVAWVVPERSGFRVPAHGRAELVSDDGGTWSAMLCDASFDGMRMRADGTVPPTGERLQAQIESDAIGPGVLGCLGRVCWTRGDEFGFAFDIAGVDIGVAGLVQQFAAHGGGAAVGDEAPVGARTRIAIDLPCDLIVPGGHVHRLRTVDISPTGVGLVGEVGRDLLGQSVAIALRIVDGEHRRIGGCVTRQSRGRLGVALAPAEGDAAWLRDLVDMAIRTRVVSQDVLRHWIALGAGDAAAPERIVVVERILRDDDGGIDAAALPCPFAGA